MYDYEDYIREAFETVGAWELPEEDFAQAVNDQARIMAGQDLYYSGEDHTACPSMAHRH